jgi:hypothetical protein
MPDLKEAFDALRLAVLLLAGSAATWAERADLAPFARPCCSQDAYRLQTTFDYNHPRGVVTAQDGTWIYGLQWAEERDLFEVAVDFGSAYDARPVKVQYWFHNWPYTPPRMPTIEDPVDDPWQGEWLTAKTEISCDGRRCRFRFLPLERSENRLAANLPGVRYRRAIRFRLRFPAGPQPELESVKVFSESKVKLIELRVLFGVDQGGVQKGIPVGQPTFTAYNGRIRNVKPISESTSLGAFVTVDAFDPQPPGSNDVPVIGVRYGSYSFSFTPSDVEKGPMYVPDYHAYITLASDRAPFSRSIVKRGMRVRERLAREPEQSYERASKEIPPLDAVERQGGRLYLPLAVDASWQKFALEWGGNVAISKRGTKAHGRELQRLTWPGDRISWRIGTGATPTFRPRSEDATLSVLGDVLPPISVARWSSESIDYERVSIMKRRRLPHCSADHSHRKIPDAVSRPRQCCS